MKRWPLILAALLCLAAADDPAEHLKNPKDEARAEALFREVRCPVCQGESIAESDAPLAADLRRVIRGHIAIGASDAEIRQFLSARYGDFVLFRPWISRTNALLWSGPFLVALAGLGWLITRERRRPTPTPDLSPDEETRLAALEREPDKMTPELRFKNAHGLTER
jgi:cytochrome c-type biogenesis protein CcmH